MITISFEVGGLEKTFDLLVDSAKQVEPALRKWDQYFARKVQQRFDRGGPGWEPLSEEQSTRNQKKAAESFVRKIGREGAKQASKSAAAEAALSKFKVTGRALGWVLGEGHGTEEERGELATKSKRSARALQRRIQTFEEAKRMAAGEEGLGLLKPKAAAKLQERFGRAKEKGGKILGKIAQSFKSKIERGTLTRESEISWAGIHNEGGKVGRGAEIPARPFLFLEDEDVDVLVGILENKMLLALE